MLTRSQQATRTELEHQLAGAVTNAEQGPAVADQLFQMADLLGKQPDLLHSLTDPGRSVASRQELMNNLVEGHVLPATRAILDAVVGRHWVRPGRLPGEVDHLGVLTVLNTAKMDGSLHQVGAELYSLVELFGDNRDLRVQLSDLGSGAPAEQLHLLNAVIGGKVLPATEQLARRAVELSSPGRLLGTLRGYAREAARLEGAELVTVSSAQPLEDAQSARLQKLLERRLGRPVILAAIPDPDVIGGFRLSYGQEATDATVKSELEGALRAMTR